jgi:NADH pyrophosphatase NudC (nudix superfamily)
MEREALKLALEALERTNPRFSEDVMRQHEAITAIKAVLAQPAQEPLAFDAFLESEDFYELMQAYRHFPIDALVQFEAVKDALRTAHNVKERNFCPRCGKRTNDIHTCTPPQGAA